MALQIFEHVFPNFWCFDLLFPYACVRIDGRVGGRGGVGGHDIHRLETWIPCVSRLGSLKFEKIPLMVQKSGEITTVWMYKTPIK